jgi:hypothetical protein
MTKVKLNHIIEIDDNLNKYKEKITFKSKLDMANNMLKTVKLPSLK